MFCLLSHILQIISQWVKLLKINKELILWFNIVKFWNCFYVTFILIFTSIYIVYDLFVFVWHNLNPCTLLKSKMPLVKFFNHWLLMRIFLWDSVHINILFMYAEVMGYICSVLSNLLFYWNENWLIMWIIFFSISMLNTLWSR